MIFNKNNRHGAQACKLELPPSLAGGFDNTELKRSITLVQRSKMQTKF